MSSQLLSTPATHPFSLTGLVDRAWMATTEGAFHLGAYSWGSPLCRLAEAAVVRTLQNIQYGQLRIHTPERTYVFPDSASPAKVHAEVRVVRPAFWLRLCLMSDLGFSEAYMFGDIDCDDLIAVFTIFCRNREHLSPLHSTLASVLGAISGKLAASRFLSNLTNSRGNISCHYDISNNMFTGFLSNDMTYSCAIFDDHDADLHADQSQSSPSPPSSPRSPLSRASSPTAFSSDSEDGEFSKFKSPQRRLLPAESNADFSDPLYAAQIRKFEHLIRKADIRPGHRVLEIGSGWGPLAVHITNTIPGTTVDTVTLSVQQAKYVKERVRKAGLGYGNGEQRVTVHVFDYRNMPAEWEGTFDRLVCVEMIENVGREYIETYWSQVDWALKKDTGAGVVQVITIPEARYDNYIREQEFIRKWIFPGGHLPTVTHLMTAIRDGSKGRLVVDSIGNIGPHYSRTLREWRKRFVANFDSFIVPSLKKEYPEVMNGPNGPEEIEVFKRKWIYYFAYSEIGFTERLLGDHVIAFSREGNPEYGCQIFS
ncbi:hypothetical protein QCA50_005396 [Cerrena zonata]|uniref:Cyclopropane-fatty-acyl-phospholipid synthase n=1 Tax=Cerrena zonata TaxID=2478898 RepID=A0AAW0GGS5_9APHY